MRHLLLKHRSELNTLTISAGFKAINVFKGWSNFADDWQIRRLDYEALKNKDFIVIHDIKYKFNYVSVSYTSKLNIDYDDMIDSLFSNKD